MCYGKKKQAEGRGRRSRAGAAAAGGEPTGGKTAESCFQICFRLLSYAIMMNLGLIQSTADNNPQPTPTSPSPSTSMPDSAALLALCKAGTNFWFAGQAKCLILKRYHSARNARET